MTRLIKRQDMVDKMEQRFQATIREQHGANWRRVNTLVADQGSCRVKGDMIDFHMLEVFHGGHHRGWIDTDLETGKRQNVSMTVGTMSFVQAHTPVFQEVAGRAQLQQIYIDGSIFRDAARAMARGDPDKMRPLGFQGTFEPRLEVLAGALLDEARTPAAGGELYVDLLATQIAVLILRRRYDVAKVMPRRNRLSASELARVTDHLETNLDRTGGIDTLANLLDMEKFAFIRAFKATTGQAPHQFLIDRRMARIKDRLLHSEEKLADIAYSTGFSSQAHMTNAFAKRMGTSPGRWRRAARGTMAA